MGGSARSRATELGRGLVRVTSVRVPRLRGNPVRRILLIAADPGESALATGRLGHAGYDVVVAPGGARALGLVRAESFGLILVNAQFNGDLAMRAEAVRMCTELESICGETPIAVFSPMDVPAGASKDLYEVGVAAVICTAHRQALPALARALLAMASEDHTDIIPAGQPRQITSDGPGAVRVPGTHLPQDAYTQVVSPSSVHDPDQGSSRWVINDDAPISLAFYERAALERAISSCNGDKIAAARVLGVGKSTLYRKLKKLGIS